jgi:large subunit ribosomal protein L28
MAKCQFCGKGPQFGHNVSHAKNRTNRMWSANIQKVTLTVEGRATKVQVCTRCLRTFNKKNA